MPNTTIISLASLKEKKIDERKQLYRAAFDIDDGPFCCALDDALADCKVFREAYYGGTFAGSHINALRYTSFCNLTYGITTCRKST